MKTGVLVAFSLFKADVWGMKKLEDL